MSGALALLVVGGLVAYGYSRFKNAATSLPAAESGISSELVSADPPYVCDGRTRCSQMKSCDEATWFIRHCPNTQMDGDRDGQPCETQCR